MDTRAPAVVAVLVTHDPGDWFDEVLASLAAQDYEELSVLVLVSGGATDPTARIAHFLPGAFVRRLDADRGFGASANEVIAMVEGAAFFLLCHDDVAPAPNAVHVLVEESYRSNAGMVSPKMLRWDEPSVLLHVGMNADKTGAVVERVSLGEIDHGQHDGVRDVFVAPGGFTLIRADLFRELGGYDPAIVAMAEDLDLSWRVQIAGARVVVAPDAQVRHLQGVTGGLRGVSRDAAESEQPSLQALQRRHELRAVLKCYSAFHLLRVIPQAMLLALGEVLVALAVGDRDRARAVLGAWRWNLARTPELRRLRRALRKQRVFPDAEVRKLQLRGSARLTTYVSRLTHQGFDVAHGRVPSFQDGASERSPMRDEGPLLTGSVGLAFSEDSSFDELDDLGRRSGTDRFGRRARRPFLGSRRSRLIAWVATGLVLVFGTRSLFGVAFPLVGQLVPLGSWTSVWHHFVAGWQPAGVGTTAPAAPAFAFMGAVGTVFFGGMGLAQKVLVLGCIPLGAVGLVRFLRPLCSPRARLVAAICYLGLPLAYDALADGRWDGLVAFAAVPWILLRLARASGVHPYQPATDARGWRTDLPGQILILGIIEAVAASFAPSIVIVVLLCAVGVAAGSFVVGDARGNRRVLIVSLGATGVAALLCAPWVIGTLYAGRGAVSIFGLPGTAIREPGFGALIRFAVGPIGSSPFDWLLVAAALLPLLIGRHERMAWAGRLWVLGCLSWLLTLCVARGWTGAFAPSLTVILVPAAVMVASCIGLGVSAFETDLSGYSFGWRQAAAGAAVVLAVLGLIPIVAKTADGRWGLPSSGFSNSLNFISASPSLGASRVLWLGDPDALPLGGWSIEGGLAYGTTESGTPNADDLFAPAGPGPASNLANAVRQAMTGQTTHLGRLLAPAAVRYIVEVQALSPALVGAAPSPQYVLPESVTSSLTSQADLQLIPGGQGFTVFLNTEYLPERGARVSPIPKAPLSRPQARGVPSPSDLVGWQPILAGAPGALAFSGPVSSGTVFASLAPAGRWQLTTNGIAAPRESVFGWASQFSNVPAGPARLAFKSTPLAPLSALLELALWFAVAAALLGRQRWLDWWWLPLQRRRTKKLPPPPSRNGPRHAAKGTR